MTRFVPASVVIVLGLGLVGTLIYMRTDPSPETAIVEEILQTPQTYGTEIFENLVALGPEGVPAIGATLSKGVEFPSVLVDALREIGDPRGVRPILMFIEASAPYRPDETSSLTARAIRALSSIPNSESCELLIEIMRSRDAHARIRLASAGTVARICERNGEREAVDVLLEYYDKRSEYFADRSGGFAQSELYRALSLADDPRVAEILLGVMNSSYSYQVIVPIIEFAKRQSGEEFNDALLKLLDDRQELELSVRLDIARHLVSHEIQGSDLLTTRVRELQLEVEQYRPELADEARQLSQ